MSRLSLITALTAAATLTTGAALGSIQSETIQAHETETYTWTADVSGEVTISIDGDGDTDLDLAILDAQGNTLDSDTSLDDNEQVSFMAVSGRSYDIKIENHGNVYNDFDLELSAATHNLSGRVSSEDTKSYTYSAAEQSGSEVVLTLHGDGDTDLDIEVFDSAGNRIASSAGSDDHERVTFFSAAGREYEIVISNLGDVYNDFTLNIED